MEELGRLGCARVVLARELTLAEIRAIRAGTDVEIEVFVHGAMCFSYSGLCLFSSYLGGKSGLRGRCVQPCRRAYTVEAGGRKGRGGRGGYLFSMNDLGGLDAVRELRDAGVTSLKIEGRLRSARYVEKVVGAYRLVLDASPDGYEEARREAEHLLAQAMSRKTSPGYFFSPHPQEAITPSHSGNLGLHLGRVAGPHGGKHPEGLQLTVKEPVAVGERLRLHLEPSGERIAFSLKTLLIKANPCDRAEAGAEVVLGLPRKLGAGWRQIDVYKVDVAGKRTGGGADELATGAVKKDLERQQSRIRRWVSEIRRQLGDIGEEKGSRAGGKRPARQPAPGARRDRGRVGMEWWLKTDSARLLTASRLPVQPDRFVVTLERQNVSQAGQLKSALGKQVRRLTWSLPPIVLDRDWGWLRKQITLLARGGFRSFQLGHCSQLRLFEGERVFLSGDYTLNLLNSQSLKMVEAAGFESAQLAVEADRAGLQEAVAGYKRQAVSTGTGRKGGGGRVLRLGLTVYGRPPLFTSRIAAPFFPYDRPVLSPKNEPFVITKKDGVSQTRPRRPFSLLPYLPELKAMGLDFVVVDLSGGPAGKKELQEVADRLVGKGRLPKLSTFNYLGRLE